jgi:hypothetical protein
MTYEFDSLLPRCRPYSHIILGLSHNVRMRDFGGGEEGKAIPVTGHGGA